VSLIFKNKKGKVIDKNGYEEEEGNIYYNKKKVGQFYLNTDSHLGSYNLLQVGGQEYHDHYFSEETIIEENKLDLHS
jgi:hypothetical protein